MTLGDFIKEYVADHTMTEFIRDSGLSKAYVYMLVNNKNNKGEPIVPSIETIKKVAKGIHKPFDEVFRALDPDLIVTTGSLSSSAPAAALPDPEASHAMELYMQLDQADRHETEQFMEFKLTADKYQRKEGYRAG